MLMRNISYSEKQIRNNTKPLGQFLGNHLADRALAVQYVGYSALRGAIGEVFLLQTVLVHQETQHFARSGLLDGEMFVFIRLHLVGQEVEYVGQRMRLVVTYFVQQNFHRRANLCVIGFVADFGHTNQFSALAKVVRRSLKSEKFLLSIVRNHACSGFSASGYFFPKRN